VRAPSHKLLWTLRAEGASAPLPRVAARSDTSRILGLSLAASAGLHIGSALLVLAVHWWLGLGIRGRAQDLDISVSYVPLSALETNLPQGVRKPSPSSEAERQLQLQEEVSKAQPPPKAEEISDALKRSPKREPEPQERLEPRKNLRMEQDRAALNTAALGVASGTGDPSEPARMSYQDMVATLLARAKRYPPSAVRRQTTGEGTIRITILPGGDVTDVEIVRSTDSPVLDEELKEMVERAAPFPPFPKDLTKRSLSVVVPVSFQLGRS